MKKKLSDILPSVPSIQERITGKPGRPRRVPGEKCETHSISLPDSIVAWVDKRPGNRSENVTRLLREAMEAETRGLPAYRIYYEDGSSYVTSMAASVSLEDARAYFVGQWLTQPDESRMRVVDVHPL